MTQEEIMTEIDVIIDESKTAILASTTREGLPRMRWMTPTLLKDRKKSIFAVTSPSFAKVNEVNGKPDVEWMFQTANLSTIITVQGIATVIENASLKAEILEAIGRRLTAFWKLNEDSRNLIVIETVINRATYFLPMKGLKRTIAFS